MTHVTSPPPPRKPTLQTRLAPYLHRFERAIDRLRYRWYYARRRRWSPAILAYAGFRRPGRFRLVARAFQQNPPVAGATKSRWRRFLTMWRRMVAREIPFARVEASTGHVTETITADEEGMLDVTLADSSIDIDGEPSATLRLVEPVEGAAAVLTPRHISTHHPSSRFVVISDVDDTVVRMKVLGMRRLLSTIVFADARSRTAFDGVPDLYRALHDSDRSRNPVVYVSSSPWNVHDLIEDFLALNGLPEGAILLRNWGLSDTEIFPTRHAAFKRAAIDRVLSFFAPLPAVLIGDDAEEDPEIYADLAHTHPDDIRKIYIRRLPDRDGTRLERMTHLMEELDRNGISLCWTDSAEEMLEDARGAGLVS